MSLSRIYRNQFTPVGDNSSNSMKVFTNQRIVDNILKYVKGDMNNRLKSRLVNKAFNFGIIHSIRIEHQTVIFHKPTRCDIIRRCPNCTVNLNSVELNVKNIRKYARFLKQTMKITVFKIIIEDLEFSCIDREIIHLALNDLFTDSDYERVEEFIGVDNICIAGCGECRKMIQNCKVYGPIQLDIFQSVMGQKRSFDALQITDEDLYVLLWLNKQKDPKLVENFINSIITCSKFTIFLTSIFEKKELGHSLPRELVDMLITKWNVKTVEIGFKNVTNDDFYQNTDYIDPKAKFYVDYRTQQRSMYTLDVVEINIKLTRIMEKCHGSLFNNFVPNVRTIFPSNKITLKLSKEVCKVLMNPDNVEDFISGVILMAQNDDHPNSHISLKLYPQQLRFRLITSFLCDNLVKLFGFWSLKSVSKISENERGKSFHFFNRSINCNINFDVVYSFDVVEYVD
ncbi:F-box C protein [Caenorhabditis elegans]|uniref:F-box C protein n=1 Tax=Caenorhabditis elegans TaxID=6239 RepID=Q9U2D4_CAEEL|nr:F-box C protein [Caenorhabditis elegans]CAB55091.2 F-box C protein [Caenorhabditis elegans]|eukprot:NP_499436.1 Uncharacterized protein CELE_Y47D3A.1 [Caenorhabditis elegans]